MMQVTKVWWDGEKLMAEPVDPTTIYQEPAQQQKPAAPRWQQAPLQTAWGDEMVVASVAIDKDHTVDLYCERDQTPKVDVMFAQRTWVGLTDKEIGDLSREMVKSEKSVNWLSYSIEAKLKEKNSAT